jgi:hypothetical protein
MPERKTEMCFFAAAKKGEKNEKKYDFLGVGSYSFDSVVDRSPAHAVGHHKHRITYF